MRLSLFSDYSLRILMYAALRKGETFSLSEAAESYSISRHHLVKVVNHLANLDLLATRRGRGGGITLGRPAEDIRIGQVVRQTESSVGLVECFDPQTNTCPINGQCRLKGVLAEAMGAFYTTLDRYTLADLVAGTRGQQLTRILLSNAA